MLDGGGLEVILNHFLVPGIPLAHVGGSPLATTPVEVVRVETTFHRRL